MRIRGVVISGSKEGSYFMSLKGYKDQFKEKLGFSPFPGTLNIGIDEDEIFKVKKIHNYKLDTVHGFKTFGDVKFVEVTINDEINGALIFPEKTHHPEDVIEVIAPVNLRNTLNLKDGDLVVITIKVIK